MSQASVVASFTATAQGTSVGAAAGYPTGRGMESQIAWRVGIEGSPCSPSVTTLAHGADTSRAMHRSTSTRLTTPSRRRRMVASRSPRTDAVDTFAMFDSPVIPWISSGWGSTAPTTTIGCRLARSPVVSTEMLATSSPV